MNRSIEEIKQVALPILRDAHVERSALFGSVARGEAGKESDIDILVDLPDNKSLFDLVELKERLEEALGSDVDIVTYRSISPLIKERILSEQVPIL